MHIKILGSGCANCVKLEEVTHQAVDDLGLNATFEKITDHADIASYQVMHTPALAIDDEVVSAGRVPSVAQVSKILSTR